MDTYFDDLPRNELEALARAGKILAATTSRQQRRAARRHVRSCARKLGEVMLAEWPDLRIDGKQRAGRRPALCPACHEYGQPKRFSTWRALTHHIVVEHLEMKRIYGRKTAKGADGRGISYASSATSQYHLRCWCGFCTWADTEAEIVKSLYNHITRVGDLGAHALAATIQKLNG